MGVEVLFACEILWIVWIFLELPVVALGGSQVVDSVDIIHDRGSARLHWKQKETMERCRIVHTILP